MAEEDIKAHTISGVKWTAFEQIGVQSITFVMSVILARLLDPTDYGTVGVLSIFMAVSGTFIDSGFGQALVREPKIKEADYSTVFFFNFGVSTLCYVVLFFCSPLIASFFDMPILSSIVKVYCLTLVINALGAVPRTKMIRDLEFKLISKINVACAFFSGVIGVVLAYAGWGVWALVWQSVFSTIFSNVVVWIFARWLPKRIFSKESFKKLFGFGSKLLAGGLIWQLYANLTPIIIGKFYSPKDLGLYSKGANLAQLPASIIYNVLSRVAYPIFAKLQSDQERLLYIYKKYIKISSMPIMFALLLLIALAKPVVLILFTEKWADCIIFLQLFGISILTDHIDKLNITLLQVVGRSDLTLKLEIYKRLISVTILFAAIPFGVVGICVSKIIYSQIALMFNTYYAGKLFGFGYWSQIKDFIQYIAISIVAVAPAFLLTFTSLSNWATIIIGSVIAAVIYLGALKVSHDDALNDCYNLIRQNILHKR